MEYSLKKRLQMLNISHNKLNKTIALNDFKAHKKLFNKNYFSWFNKLLVIFTLLAIVSLFLPWTQNVTGKGYVTTLNPNQRPQSIQSPIPGRIEKWYVREGDLVKKGDTLLFISEIKNQYQDPNLLSRIKEQRNAKNNSFNSYETKVGALSQQINALERERKLKLQQANNKLKQAKLKVVSDSIDLEAIKTNLQIAERQYNRTLQLQEEGLKAITDVETKKLKQREMQSKLVSQQNKLLTSTNEIINYRLELDRIKAQYADKLAKALSEKSSASSSKFDTEAQISKLENQYSNYKIRTNLQYITAPQNGQINKAIISGIGETFKEGQTLITIMPSEIDIAVETYIEPIDYPLIHIGEEVRIQFDGWPAVFFSGWPNAAYGTFSGKVIAAETFISDNGKFRILIAPNDSQNKWPKTIRVGSGAYTIALLDDVSIWYELWRKLNGFPPNYYQPKATGSKKKKKLKLEIK